MTASDPRTAIVTGGSGGIGIACAQVLIEHGYDVVLTARTESRLKATAAIGSRSKCSKATTSGTRIRARAVRMQGRSSTAGNAIQSAHE